MVGALQVRSTRVTKRKSRFAGSNSLAINLLAAPSSLDRGLLIFPRGLLNAGKHIQQMLVAGGLPCDS